ncbi:HET-domain-containing protein [Cadophora sp. DSE1049]|nr:HET-domain-containing protein [Cadophora sp. DSE1049]
MPSEAGGEEAFETVGAWFGACVQEHGGCRPGGEGSLLEEVEVVELPHRVLDVEGVSGDEGVICLVETEVDDVLRKGQYVALSHRWPVDPKEHFMTTRPLLEQRKKMIRLEDMPASYRDAVMVTRRLGMRYLWIDSLCIVQDDAEDWEREAALMGSIYHNSTVTVMAATSSIKRLKGDVGGSEQEVEYSRNGFLGNRKGSKEHLRVRLEYVDEEWRETGDYWEVVDRGNVELVDQNMELFTRGWVMQEEMLPRRRILYTPGQLVWHCNVMVIREINRKVRCDVADMQKDEGFIDHWLGLAERYSERYLTYESDKLPALSGLATYFSELYKQKYYAGIFNGAVAETLLWRPTKLGGLEKPERYVAPSWSWVRPNGWIKMVAPQQPGGSRDLRAVSQLESMLEDVRFELRSEVAEAPYGRIKEGGLMRVSGLVKDVWMERVESDDDHRMVKMRLIADGKFMSVFYLDFFNDLDEGSMDSGVTKWNVKCLWVLKECEYVLVLRAVGNDSCLYERIGLADIDPAWYDFGGFRREHISII